MYLLPVVPQSVIADQGSLFPDLGAVEETAHQTAHHLKRQQTTETELSQAQRFVANKRLREFSGLFGLEKFRCIQSSERSCQRREREPCALALLVTDLRSSSGHRRRRRRILRALVHKVHRTLNRTNERTNNIKSKVSAQNSGTCFRVEPSPVSRQRFSGFKTSVSVLLRLTWKPVVCF